MKKIIKTPEKIGKILLILMFSFSQLSFPIEVLADELTEKVIEEQTLTEEVIANKSNKMSTEETISNTENIVTKETLADPTPVGDKEVTDESTTSKYKVTINGQESTEYTLTNTDNKEVTIEQTYDGEEGTYTFDNPQNKITFHNMLYGTYQYTYSVSNETGILESITLTIHYNGENSEILNQNSSVPFTNGAYQIKGMSSPLTVADVLKKFNQETLNNNYSATLSIIDAEGNTLTEDATIQNGDKLILTNGIVTEHYPIKIEGDYNSDNIVNVDDAKNIIDKILADESKDETPENKFNILDATLPVFTNGTWESIPEAKDILSNSLVNKAELNKGEVVEVKYYITGFEFDKLTGIEGTINYDQNLLQLISINIDNLYGNINEEGHFAYLLNNYQSNGILMTLTFKAKKPGESKVSIDHILASTGAQANLDSDSIATTITILDYGKGGDVETINPVPTSKLTPESVPPKVEAVPQPAITNINKRIQILSLSSDNLIKTLTIEGYDLDFDQNKLEYSIKVKNDVKSLNINVILNSESASYTIEGNENLKVGENTINIVVKAENENTRTYTIKVNKEKADTKKNTTEDNDEATNDSSKPIIIVLIILVIIGLTYVIFKDDEEDKKGSNK